MDLQQGTLFDTWLDGDGERTSLATAMTLLGSGTVGDVRSCGVPCDLGALARAAKGVPGLAIGFTPEGFRSDIADVSLKAILPRIAEGWPQLLQGAMGVLGRRGDYRRVALVLGSVEDVMDVRPFVFRHAFDLLNVGEVELVEDLVFDEAFGAPDWLRDALSAAEGILWTGLRSYRGQARRAREVQKVLADVAATGRFDGDRVAMAQAWSLLDLYASWGDAIPPAADVPSDLVDDADDLLRCLWTLRRSRQLMALGHLEGALRLLEAAEGLAARDSIVGVHLRLDRFLCRILTGRTIDAAELRGIRAAAQCASRLNLDLLSLSIDGYTAAALAYVDVDHRELKIERLAERSLLHPDPILHAALSIGCAADAYRRHSFYAALGYVRDLSDDLAYLGSTDLTCCAYGIEMLCRGAVGEGPLPPPKLEDDRPSVLAFHPFVRTIHEVSEELSALADEFGVDDATTALDGVDPSYAANVLSALALRGTWSQANALRGLLPDAWQRPPRPVVEADGPAGRPSSDRAESPVPYRPGEGAVLPRVHLATPLAPKLTLRMLGSFEVWVGESRVTDDRWRRKAGKVVLQALAIAPSHTVTRAHLCELIWPDLDYLSSRTGLYSVLSSARDAISGRERTPYLLCERGLVSLNAKLAECDVDLFENRCREVLSRRGDLPWRLSICRELGPQYHGGLFVPAQDVRGDFQARGKALESLYVDVLVEAASLALQAGIAKEALWFANDAFGREPLREDVVSCRLRALAAEGRGRELHQTYTQYCAELSDGLFMPPSARMRSLHENLMRYVEDQEAPGDELLRNFEESYRHAA